MEPASSLAATLKRFAMPDNSNRGFIDGDPGDAHDGGGGDAGDDGDAGDRGDQGDQDDDIDAVASYRNLSRAIRSGGPISQLLRDVDQTLGKICNYTFADGADSERGKRSWTAVREDVFEAVNGLRKARWLLSKAMKPVPAATVVAVPPGSPGPPMLPRWTEVSELVGLLALQKLASAAEWNSARLISQSRSARQAFRASGTSSGAASSYEQVQVEDSVETVSDAASGGGEPYTSFAAGQPGPQGLRSRRERGTQRRGA